jgi:pimeloyl-ACP methyl ester carboxylesterase
MDPSPAHALVKARHWPPVGIIPAAGHQLYLDNPTFFNQYLVRLVKHCK